MQPTSATHPSHRTEYPATGLTGPLHIPSLDGIRALSITIVLTSHAGLSQLIPGGFGVTVFFFLSGYLITNLLCREYDRHERIAMSHFYLRRIIRLGPPLLIAVAIGCAAVLSGLANGDLNPSALLSQLFFYYNYYALYGSGHESVDGLGILWSLSVEEHFYIMWPVVFLAIGRRRITLGHVVAALIVLLAWRVVRYSLLGHSEWAIYISTDTRLDSLLYGCLLSLIDWRGLSGRTFPTGALSYILIATSVLALGATFVVSNDFFRSTLRYSVQGIALMPLFYYAVTMHHHSIFRPLNWSCVKRLGVYSYSMYLVHFVIIKILIDNEVADMGSLTLLAIAGGLSVLISAAIYEIAEKPLRPLRRRLTGH